MCELKSSQKTFIIVHNKCSIGNWQLVTFFGCKLIFVFVFWLVGLGGISYLKQQESPAAFKQET